MQRQVHHAPKKDRYAKKTRRNDIRRVPYHEKCAECGTWIGPAQAAAPGLRTVTCLNGHLYGFLMDR